MPAFWSSVSELLWSREASVLWLASSQGRANSRFFLSLFLTPAPPPAPAHSSPSGGSPQPSCLYTAKQARLGHWDSPRPCRDAGRAPGQKELVWGPQVPAYVEFLITVRPLQGALPQEQQPSRVSWVVRTEKQAAKHPRDESGCPPSLEPF